MSDAELKRLNDELEALIKENEKILSQLRTLKNQVSAPERKAKRGKKKKKS